MELSSQHVHFNATVYSRVRELDFSLVRFVSCKHAAKNVFSSVVFMCFEVKGKVKSFHMLVTERWARSRFRCTGSQPTVDVK